MVWVIAFFSPSSRFEKQNLHLLSICLTLSWVLGIQQQGGTVPLSKLMPRHFTLVGQSGILREGMLAHQLGLESLLHHVLAV